MLRKLVTTFLLVALALVAAACSGNSTGNNNHNQTNEEHNEGEAGHESAEMIPNDGAVIRLISPTDGATFSVGEEIPVEVEIENFAIGQDGNHWHIHVGDIEYAMIMGENTSDVIRGLDPGEYIITVRMANGDHQDLEDGDTATITVTE